MRTFLGDTSRTFAFWLNRKCFQTSLRWQTTFSARGMRTQPPCSWAPYSKTACVAWQRGNGVLVSSGDVLQSLADKLRQAEVISPLARKQASFWIGIRDSADHARFDEYSADQVQEALRGVSTFLAEHLS